MSDILFTVDDFPETLSNFLGSVYQLEFPVQGMTSVVAIVSAAKGTYVVKRSRGHLFSRWLGKEYEVLKVLTQTPLPVPYPHLFLGHDTAEGVEAWLVMSKLPGEPLATVLARETSQDVCQDLLREFGKTLMRIHRHTALLEPQSDRTLAGAEYNLLHPIDGSVELLEQLKKQQPVPVFPTFIHGDFTIDNTLIMEGKVTGIIDWAGGGMGDPRYDLTLAIRPQETGLFQALPHFA